MLPPFMKTIEVLQCNNSGQTVQYLMIKYDFIVNPLCGKDLFIKWTVTVVRTLQDGCYKYCMVL